MCSPMLVKCSEFRVSVERLVEIELGKLITCFLKKGYWAIK